MSVVGNGVSNGARGSFIQAKLFVKHADPHEGAGAAPVGWYIDIRHFVNGSMEPLTMEPVSIAQVVAIAKALSKATDDTKLMPYVETMTAQVLESIQKAADHQAKVIEHGQKALAELQKITKHVEGDAPVIHQEVARPDIERQKLMRREREELMEQIRVPVEEE